MNLKLYTRPAIEVTCSKSELSDMLSNFERENWEKYEKDQEEYESQLLCRDHSREDNKLKHNVDINMFSPDIIPLDAIPIVTVTSQYYQDERFYYTQDGHFVPQNS